MDESELRRRFAELREDDRHRAPSFAQISGRVRARRTRRATWRVRSVVVAATAAVAVATVWLARGRSFAPPAVTPTITTWRAPTDVLLRTPGSELLGAMPTLGASVLDAMNPTPLKRGT